MGVGAEALAVRLFLCQQRATTTPSGHVWIVIVAVDSEPTIWARAVCPGFGTQKERLSFVATVTSAAGRVNERPTRDARAAR
jgi:hypothetical protein